MAFRDIIVSIDPSPSGEQRTQIALRLAQRFSAHLVGYYVGPTVGEYMTTSAEERRRFRDQVLRTLGIERSKNTSSQPPIFTPVDGSDRKIATLDKRHPFGQKCGIERLSELQASRVFGC